MFKIPLHHLNEDIIKSSQTQIKTHKNHLYVLNTLPNNTILTITPLLPTKSQYSVKLNKSFLTAKIKLKTKINLVLCGRSTIVEMELQPNNNLEIVKEHRFRFYNPVLVGFCGDVCVVRDRNKIFTWGEHFKELHIFPLFSKVKNVRIFEDKIVYNTSKHIFAYDLNGRMKSKIRASGLLLNSKSNVCMVYENIVSVYKWKNGLVWSHKIDINLEFKIDWVKGKYVEENNLLFLSSKNHVYVDGYFFDSDSVFTGFYVYKNCFLGATKDNLYFLPNDKDFELEFSIDEKNRIYSEVGNNIDSSTIINTICTDKSSYIGDRSITYCSQNEELKSTNQSINYGERMFNIQHIKGTVSPNIFICCLIHFGVKLEIKKLILNEINAKKIEGKKRSKENKMRNAIFNSKNKIDVSCKNDKLKTYKAILEFDMDAKIVWKSYLVNIHSIYGSISNVFAPDIFNVELIVKMNRILFADKGYFKEIDFLADLDEFKMMKFILSFLNSSENQIIEEDKLFTLNNKNTDSNTKLSSTKIEKNIELKESIETALRVVEISNVYKKYKIKIGKFLLKVDENHINVVKSMVKNFVINDFKNPYDFLSFLIKNKCKYEVINAYNTHQLDINPLIDGMCTDIEALKKLTSINREKMKNAIKVKREWETEQLTNLYNYYREMNYNEEMIISLIRLYRKEENRNLIFVILDLLGEKVLIIDNEFVGRETFTKTTKNHNDDYRTIIKENVKKLKLLKPWNIWTDVGEAELCGYDYYNYVDLLKKAENIYFGFNFK